MTAPVLGIIGGSGIYAMDAWRNPEWRAVTTPFGKPSDALCFGTLHGVKAVFLPRHGRNHSILPNEVNYRANIDALKRAGATDVLALSACGSLREDFKPGEFAISTQFIDRTFLRRKSFFGNGCVAHVSMAEPVCRRLSDMVFAAGEAVGLTMHREATTLVMEGPQFSTKAESELYRQWGCDAISMTQMPEAKLAREAELPYTVFGMISDYDCWHPAEDNVEYRDVVATLQKNATAAKRMVEELAKAFAAFGNERPPSPQGIETVLDIALVTPPEARGVLPKLDAILARVNKNA